MAKHTDPALLAAFAEILVALRNRSGYPQHKVAEYLGVTPGLLSQWEGGKGEPKFFQVVALSELYNVHLDVLAGRIPLPPPEPRGSAKRSLPS